jgi:cyclophilin family peptidyl-prolyl cis-trans isomerase
MRHRFTVLLVLAAVLVAACGDKSSDTTADTSAAAPPSETTLPPTESASTDGCKDVAQPEAKPDGGQRKPKGKLDASKSYTVTVKTNCGSFSFELDLKSAPKTSASLVSLAKKGFYDGTMFHRIVPGFVIQGGDPTATGSGGPGYKTRDVPAADTTYKKGTVAMAKAGPEAAGTSGSQFFVVTDDAGGAGLTPDYAVVGKISKGIDVVDRIGALGNEQQQPTRVVVIEKMTVRVK